MFRTMLKSKIHRATVTQADLHYVGSVTVDEDLMDAADLLAGEQVAIVDITNGARLETYVIPGQRGSGVIGINGAAARLVAPGRPRHPHRLRRSWTTPRPAPTSRGSSSSTPTTAIAGTGERPGRAAARTGSGDLRRGDLLAVRQLTHRLAAPAARPSPGWTRAADVVVVGSGVAGLSAVLHAPAAGLSVVLVTKALLDAGSTRWAQGGIAAALGPDDDPEQHLRDTLAAGVGICDEAAVRLLVHAKGRRGYASWPPSAPPSTAAAGGEFRADPRRRPLAVTASCMPAATRPGSRWSAR